MKNLPKLVHQPRRGQHDIVRKPKKFKKVTLSCGRSITMHHHQPRPHLYHQPTISYHQPVVYYYPAAIPTSPIVVVSSRTNDRNLCMNKKRRLCNIINPTSKRDDLDLEYSQSKGNTRLLLQENKPKKSNAEKSTDSAIKASPVQYTLNKRKDSVQKSDNDHNLKLSADISKKDGLKERCPVNNNNTSDDSEEDEIGAWVYQQSQMAKDKPKKKIHVNTKAKRRQCKHDGCTNIVVNKGVCIRHGAQRRKRQTCGHDGCSNFIQKGGVCWRHGARRSCGHDGCSNFVIRGEVCWRHGAKNNAKICMIDGCTKYAVKEGCCVGHGTSFAVESLLSLRDGFL